MNPVFWLVGNTVLACWWTYELREEKKVWRGLSGFCLAMSLSGIIRHATTLLSA